MNPEALALLTDNSLSDAARILAFYIRAMGEGWHELDRAELAGVLHGYPNADTIGRHLGQLERARYVESQNGGRRPNRYRWLSRDEARNNEAASRDETGNNDLSRDEARDNGESPANGHGTTPPARDDASVEEMPLGSMSASEDEGSSQGIKAADGGLSRTGEDEGREAAVEAMQAVANDYARHVPTGIRRKHYNADVRKIVSGDDYAAWTAWKDHTGSQVPWPDRPRLLRMALDEYIAGDGGQRLRSCLRYVIPQQYDPVKAPTADELERRRRQTDEAADPAMVEDVKRLLSHATSMVWDATGRPIAERKLAQNYPDVWQRAGPAFQALDLTALRTAWDKENDYAVTQAIREQLREQEQDRAA